MLQWMLKNIITRTFEKEVGKWQRRYHDEKDKRHAMHVGWSFYRGYNEDGSTKGYEYKTIHMIIFAPCNYVYVAIMPDEIMPDGEQKLGVLEIISYHDSCWRDGIDRFIFDNEKKLNGFRSEKLFDWYDIIELTEAEADYLSEVEVWRRNRWNKDDKMPQELIDKNPFVERWKR